MNAKFLLDTNIIIYSFDDTAPEKQAIALELIERAVKTEDGCISAQVIQETLFALTSKFKHLITASDLLNYLETVLESLYHPLPAMPLYRDVLSIRERWKFGFYDALIIAAALALECDRLYTEDFQHGQRIEGLSIVNPFL